MGSEVKNGVNKEIKQTFREQMDVAFTDGKSKETHTYSMSSITQNAMREFLLKSLYNRTDFQEYLFGGGGDCCVKMANKPQGMLTPYKLYSCGKMYIF